MIYTTRNKCNKLFDGGFSLLEILLSLFIFSIALFGFLELQIKTQALVNDSQLRFHAVQQINDLKELLHVNLQPNVAQWNNTNKQLLPQSNGTLATIGNQQWQIKLDWHSLIKNNNPCPQSSNQQLSCLTLTVYR
ncbi:MAG: prepilin-type N-terminal cleavage/methylation domain-containing protein [Gammaproteobacteria bacterium]|nr:prepilin-type N-terminal cleavage/methylation domain-containing protein [Gammaproteobacteria bacterium]